VKWRFLDICSSCATSPGRPFSRWPNPQARENAALLNSWEILTSASASMSATIDRDQSIFAAGLVLFAMTFVFNVFGYWLRRRYHQAY